jgi:hypothetical protein
MVFSNKGTLKLKDLNRRGERVVSCGTYCPACVKWWKENNSNLIINSQIEEDKWFKIR